MNGWTQEEFVASAIAWVERECAEQGIPVKLSDQETIEKVAELLAQGIQTARKRDGSKRL
jgi:alpha-D-ribose 1-methylphosphonate 5-triphosphate diphosphatase PhnM